MHRGARRWSWLDSSGAARDQGPDRKMCEIYPSIERKLLLPVLLSSYHFLYPRDARRTALAVFLSSTCLWAVHEDRPRPHVSRSCRESPRTRGIILGGAAKPTSSRYGHVWNYGLARKSIWQSAAHSSGIAMIWKRSLTGERCSWSPSALGGAW